MGFDYDLFYDICKALVTPVLDSMLANSSVKDLILSKSDFTHVCQGPPLLAGNPSPSILVRNIDNLYGVNINTGESVKINGCTKKESYTFDNDTLYKILLRPEVLSGILLSDIKSGLFNSKQDEKVFVQEIQTIFKDELMIKINETLSFRNVCNEDDTLEGRKCNLMNNFAEMFDRVTKQNKLNPVFQNTMFEYFTGYNTQKNVLLDNEHFIDYKPKNELCPPNNFDVAKLKKHIQRPEGSGRTFEFANSNNPGGNPLVYIFAQDDSMYSMDDLIIGNVIDSGNNKGRSCRLYDLNKPIDEVCNDPIVGDCIDNMNRLLDMQLEQAKKKYLDNLNVNVEQVIKNFVNTDEQVIEFIERYTQRIKEFHASMKKIKNIPDVPQQQGQQQQAQQQQAQQQQAEQQQGQQQAQQQQAQQPRPGNTQANLDNAVRDAVQQKSAQAQKNAEKEALTEKGNDLQIDELIENKEDMSMILDEDYQLVNGFDNLLKFLGGIGSSLADKNSQGRDNPTINVESKVHGEVKSEGTTIMSEDEQIEQCRLLKGWKWRLITEKQEVQFMQEYGMDKKSFIETICNKENLLSKFFSTMNGVYKIAIAGPLAAFIATAASIMSTICSVISIAAGASGWLAPLAAGMGVFCAALTGGKLINILKPDCLVYSMHYGIYQYFKSTDINGSPNPTLGSRILIGIWAHMYWSFEKYQSENGNTGALCHKALQDKGYEISNINSYIRDAINSMSGGDQRFDQNKFGNINLGDEMTTSEKAMAFANDANMTLDETDIISRDKLIADFSKNSALVTANDQLFCSNVDFRQYKNLVKILIVSGRLDILYTYIFCTFTGYPNLTIASIVNDIKVLFDTATNSLSDLKDIFLFKGGPLNIRQNIKALWDNFWTNVGKLTLLRVCYHIFYSFNHIMNFMSTSVEFMLDSDIFKEIVLRSFFGSKSEIGKDNPIRKMIEIGIENFNKEKQNIRGSQKSKQDQDIEIEKLKDSEFRDQFYNVNNPKRFGKVYDYMKAAFFHLLGISRFPNYIPLPSHTWFKNERKTNELGIPEQQLICYLITDLEYMFDISANAIEYNNLKTLVDYDPTTQTCKGNPDKDLLIEQVEKLQNKIDEYFGSYDCCQNDITIINNRPMNYLKDESNPNYGWFDRTQNLTCDVLNSEVVKNYRVEINEILQYITFDKQFSELLDRMILQKLNDNNVADAELVTKNDNFVIKVTPCGKDEFLVLDLKNPCVKVIKDDSSISIYNKIDLDFSNYDAYMNSKPVSLINNMYFSFIDVIQQNNMQKLLLTRILNDTLADKLYEYALKSNGLSHSAKNSELEQIFDDVFDNIESVKSLPNKTDLKKTLISDILKKSVTLDEIKLHDLFNNDSSNENMFISAMLSILNLRSVKDNIHNAHVFMIYLRDFAIKPEGERPAFPFNWIDSSTQELIVKILSKYPSIRKQLVGYLYSNLYDKDSRFHKRHWQVDIGPAAFFTSNNYNEGFTQYVDSKGRVFITQNDIPETIDIDNQTLVKFNNIKPDKYFAIGRKNKQATSSILYGGTHLTSYSTYCLPNTSKCISILKADIELNKQKFEGYNFEEHAKDLLKLFSSKRGTYESVKVKYNDFCTFMKEMTNGMSFLSKYNKDVCSLFRQETLFQHMARKPFGQKVSKPSKNFFYIENPARIDRGKNTIEDPDGYLFENFVNDADMKFLQQLVSYWLLIRGQHLESFFQKGTFPAKTTYLETLPLKSTGKTLLESGETKDMSFFSLSVVDDFNIKGDVTMNFNSPQDFSAKLDMTKVRKNV
jgi:hypothetical protein